MSKRSGVSESMRQPEPNAAAQLAFGDSARAPVTRLTVAEAHEVKVTAWPENGVEGGDVPGAGVIVEDVEEPAVDDRLEGLVERVEAQRVEHLEDGLDPAFSGLALGDLDRARGDVDAEGVGALARREDCVFAGPATRVKEGAGQRAGVSETEKGGLWAPNVPGRRRARVGSVPVSGWAGCGHEIILS